VTVIMVMLMRMCSVVIVRMTHIHAPANLFTVIVRLTVTVARSDPLQMQRFAKCSD